MKSILSNLTAAMLTLHMTLGCCWHHAHRFAEECGMAQSVDRPGCHDGDSADDCGWTAPSSHGTHRGLHECQGNTCSFVPSSNSVGNSLAQPFQAFAAPLFDDQRPLVGAGSERHFFATGWLLPPVRLHLANQVMLI